LSEIITGCSTRMVWSSEKASFIIRDVSVSQIMEPQNIQRFSTFNSALQPNGDR